MARPGADDPVSQLHAVDAAMDNVAELVAEGYDVALTHGNGPQVGNLLIKNQLARDVVPAVPLDWCVAQTQATLGYLIVSCLERALRARGLERAAAALTTRVLVDRDDPAFRNPTKPIGRERQLVPSPRPREILDVDAAVRLLRQDYVVVCAGGGGIPMVRDGDRLAGVEAVLDKDLSAALLARELEAESLVIATDVPAAAVRYGTPEQRWLGRVTPEELRELAAAGEFDTGSMGPKVAACIDFVEASGRRAVITSLESVVAGAAGETGTIVEPVAA